ncbi:MAG: glutaredoxin family protein [Gammaproteobacteria bacterium]|nr:glutaredoxin family protein [Gammaproteobacteria bacterium]
MNRGSAATLTLYTRTGCHLCEEMKQCLDEFQRDYDFSLSVVDIDADSYLRLRYGDRVPVLAVGEQEICHYRFNEDSVSPYVRKR